MNTIRRKHTAQFKVKVALELIKQEKTVREICSFYSIHPTQAGHWKKQTLEGLAVIFSQGVKNELIKKDELIGELYKQIGQLKVEAEFLKKRWAWSNRLKPKDLKTHLEINHPVLSLKRQAELLGMSRASIYYRPRPVDPLTWN
jgi:putative transposase